MTLAMFRVMALQFLRDPVALVSTLVLPPLVFLVWATRAGTGGEATIRAAATVSTLFVMIAAMRGALSLIDERDSGVADRILAGGAGTGPVINGKFLFLLVQGVVLAGAVFAAAQLVHDLPVTRRIWLWLATATVVSACAAGLALALAGACRGRRRAVLLSGAAILLFALAGEGLAPRVLATPWSPMLRWAAPNAWASEAYVAILQRGAGPATVWVAWAVLAAIGLAGLAVAHAVARR